MAPDPSAVLTHPGQPQVLAVMPGRDEAAAKQCLERLTPAQRAGIKSYRVDMGAAYNSVCAELLPKADGVIDRFHVAQLFNAALDGERKKITRQYKAKKWGHSGFLIETQNGPVFVPKPEAAGRSHRGLNEKVQILTSSPCRQRYTSRRGAPEAAVQQPPLTSVYHRPRK
jgi:transposase